MTSVPDYVPILIKGTGSTPRQGGCLVQIANWLSDNKLWTDQPVCVHYCLAEYAITINDLMSDADRPKLALLAPRLTGTAISNYVEAAHVSHRLRLWIANNPMPLRTIKTTRWTWTTNGAVGEVVANLLIDDAEAAVDWLSRLIDRYDLITGRAPVPLLTEDQGRRLRAAMAQ